MRRLSLLMPFGLAGCAGWQSALDPAGPQAAALHGLFLGFLAVALVIWTAVMALLWRAMAGRDPTAADGLVALDPRRERRAGRLVGLGVAASVLVIAALTLASYWAMAVPTGPDPLVIRVTGWQWWWQITYLDDRPERIFSTANELHLPAGRPVRLELAAGDVIHSFWLPNLAGKQDLLPGRGNQLSFTAGRPGLYRAQCAQFCGLQHAHMALSVIVEPPADFAAWQQAQLAPAGAPADAASRRGRAVFLGQACAACHAVRGTPAAGSVGPDLTHIGGRATLGAGLLPVSRGSLAAWIADPQNLKPGNNMPMVPLTADELQDVSAYLAGLK